MQRISRHKSLIGLTAAILLIAASGLWWLGNLQTDDAPSEVGDLTLPVVGRDGYSTSEACRECHPKAYDSWHRSYHRTMTQLVSPDSVQADFDNVSLSLYGRDYRFTRQGDDFYVEMPDPDVAYSAFELGLKLDSDSAAARKCRMVMSTGSHHMQTFWIASRQEGNLLRQLPWVYHLEEQMWIPNEASFIAPPTDRRRDFSVWNSTCIHCHAVGGIPSVADDRWETTVGELGIACEACHGAASEHVEFHRRNANREVASTERDSTIVHPARLPHGRASEVCGQCHADVARGASHRGTDESPSEELKSHLQLWSRETAPDPLRFWKDGTIRVGGREFSAMVYSKCFQQGELGCLSCHSMHEYRSGNHQLIHNESDNESCLQCHTELRQELTAHTHHEAESAGSVCYNCHMPYTSFGLLQGVRSHRIDSPSVEMTSRFGRPNACNQCHLDETLQWTADRLTEWYGQGRPELPEKAATYPESVRWLLQGDAAVRAITAWTYGWTSAREASGGNWQPAFLLQAMRDPYSAVRFVAWRSLKQLDGFQDFEFNPNGEATERALRIERALEMMSPVDETDLPSSVRELLDGNGRLAPPLVEKLLRDRDDTPVLLSE